MATSDRPILGVDHVTVVPTNFDGQPSTEEPMREERSDDAPLRGDGRDDG